MHDADETRHGNTWLAAVLAVIFLISLLYLAVGDTAKDDQGQQLPSKAEQEAASPIPWRPHPPLD